MAMIILRLLDDSEWLKTVQKDLSDCIDVHLCAASKQISFFC